MRGWPAWPVRGDGVVMDPVEACLRIPKISLDTTAVNDYVHSMSNHRNKTPPHRLDKPIAFRLSVEARRRLDWDERITGVPVAEILRRILDERYGMLLPGAAVPAPQPAPAPVR